MNQPSPELQEYSQQFAAVRDRANRLAAGLSHTQFNWRPAPEKWSIAECFAHLNVTGEGVVKQIRSSIADARRRGLVGSGPFAYGWFARWFERSQEPPVKKRFSTPSVMRPDRRQDYDVDAVMDRFRALLSEWRECLSLAEGLDLSRVKAPSMATRLLRFPLGATFRIHTAHERRHLWQAQQVRNGPGFPTT
jgi:hypothetical protein